MREKINNDRNEGDRKDSSSASDLEPTEVVKGYR